MIQLLAGLLAGLQLLCACVPDPTTLAMKTGVLLRMHVVAQDDTPAMQALKAPVRDAVRQVYPHRRRWRASSHSPTHGNMPKRLR